jgi:hypothetical protein
MSELEARGAGCFGADADGRHLDKAIALPATRDLRGELTAVGAKLVRDLPLSDDGRPRRN